MLIQQTFIFSQFWIKVLAGLSGEDFSPWVQIAVLSLCTHMAFRAAGGESVSMSSVVSFLVSALILLDQGLTTLFNLN